MRIITSALSVVTLLCLTPLASAFVTINLVAETVTDLSGTAVSTASGRWILVADTTRDGFNPIGAGGISVNDFVAGDDLVVVNGVFGGGFGVAGAINVSMPGLSLTSEWDTGDPLALIWFPEIGEGATEVAATDSYGLYTSALGEDLSNPWITPADGADHDLQALTAATSGFFGTGTVDSDSLRAQLAVIPEPSASILALLSGLLILRRRR
jgi:hypothetical protein